MSYLLKAKRRLANQATELYNDMRFDLDFSEYANHYNNLGETLSSIDQTETWEELLQKIMKGDFESIGMFTGEEELLEEFFVDIFGK